MSWFSRALTSAKEAVGSVNVRGVGDSARSLAGGVLSSVARVADDKVRRVGKSVHARLTGRQSFEDAVRVSPPPSLPSERRNFIYCTLLDTREARAAVKVDEKYNVNFFFSFFFCFSPPPHPRVCVFPRERKPLARHVHL